MRILTQAVSVAVLCGWIGASQGFESFQAGFGNWQLAAPVVGNIDGDRPLEIILAYRNSDGEWLVDAYKYDGRHLDGFPYRSGFRLINATPTLYDVDGDGQNEILFTAGNSIVALHGTGAVLWKTEITPANYLPDGGFQAVTNGFYMARGAPAPLATLPDSAEFFSEVSPPLVADLDGDGRQELLTAWKIDPDRNSSNQDFNPFINDIFGYGEWGATGEEWSGGVIISDALTGQKRFIYHFHQLVEAGLATAQLDGDAAREVLVLNDADAVTAFDITQAPGLFGKGMLHKKFGKNLALLSGSYLTGVDVHAADIDGDGLDEVLVATTQVDPNWQPSDSLLDDDGALLWREWKPAAHVPHAFGWYNSATLIPINPDHDNHADVLGVSQSFEVTFRSWNGTELVERPGWPKNFYPLLPATPVAGDVDGGGDEEIVIGMYDPAHDPSSGKVQVFALDGTLKYEVPIPSGVKHVPTIADVDGDGRTEVILRALDGRMHLLRFGSGGDPARISWGTHRANAQHDGNAGRDLYPAGTPIITSRIGDLRHARFSWRLPEATDASAIKIFRADQPGGTFREIASLPGAAREYVDAGLPLFAQPIYEVRAEYAGGIRASAPFPVQLTLGENLIVNGGFEEDDDSHWDKWYPGEIRWTNMLGSMAAPHCGRRSMEVRLEKQGSSSSITQFSHYGLPDDTIQVVPGTLYSFGGFMRSSGLDQETQHWFEWDSAPTAEHPETRPPLPWPNYFTPALQAGTKDVSWTYLNRVFVMPAGFPNVELRHRFTSPAPVSGSVFLDDVFFRPLPPATDARWQVWIPYGERWRYHSSAPAGDWFSRSFDDSSWDEAPAKFGQGAGPRNVITRLPPYQPAYFFRKTFNAQRGPKELLLAATCTDEFGGKTYPLRVWLNGVEVLSSGIEAVSGEGNIEKFYDLTPFVDMLADGINTIAVELGNAWEPGWDNVAFDASLRAISDDTPPLPAAAIAEMSVTPNVVRLQVQASGPSKWRLETAPSISAATWSLVKELEFAAAKSATIEITRRPGSVKFYRLQPASD